MLKKTIAAAILAVLAGPSLAAEASGAYVGADAGGTTIDSLSGRKASAGAFLGYSFNDDFTFEAGYRRLGEWQVEGTRVQATQTVISMLSAYPLNPRLNIFVRAGYNKVKVSAEYQGYTASNTTSSMMYGFGVGYNFSAHAAARLEMQKPSRDTTNLSLALLYKF
jgi:opacity protein-like surface antigen